MMLYLISNQINGGWGEFSTLFNGRHTFMFSGIKSLFFCRGRKIFEPPRYMTVNTCAEQLLEIIDTKRNDGDQELGIFILLGDFKYEKKV